MIVVWERMRDSMPNYANVIDAGIDKLNAYWASVKDIPAYTLAQRWYFSLDRCAWLPISD
jgi:hypothetical protein